MRAADRSVTQRVPDGLGRTLLSLLSLLYLLPRMGKGGGMNVLGLKALVLLMVLK